MTADDRGKSRARSGGWWIAAGLGVGVAAALVYFFDPQKGPSRRRRITGPFSEWNELTRGLREQWADALEAGLREFPAAGGDARLGRLWSPGTRLVAGALGGSLALYGYRSARRTQQAGGAWPAAQQMQRQVASTVGLQAAGR